MIYRNCLGAFEYKASARVHSGRFSAEEVKVYSADGEKVERILPYFYIACIAENFPLSEKRYIYSNEEEYAAKIEECIADMKAIGFSVSSKSPSIFGEPFVSIDFVHDETKAAADKENEETIKRNAKGENGFIRFGDVPKSGKSYNHRDNFFEEGVSAYHAIFFSDGSYKVLYHNPFEMFGAHLYSNRPAYRLYGEEIGTGSDGEPVLNVNRAVKLNDEKEDEKGE